MALRNAQVPVIGLCAPSGTGKTTLARCVIGLLCECGLRVGVVKQAREDFDVDIPGKDSYRLRKAGIERLLLGSERQSALILERAEPAEPDLDELLVQFDQRALDLILVEGFSGYPFPKIELYRQAIGRPPRFPHDTWVIAVATDCTELLARAPVAPVPVLDLNEPRVIVEFIRAYVEGDLR
jgi:molybdopterin-guanine dinucleotide biosynthesis protein MobB